ncbi:MAG: type II toxin-antitoxin system VapC family toxin [Chloroflexota bacterium]|nr:type II toxin-antitoxin system VapC family toxin [Chloroflexota bacterium]
MYLLDTNVVSELRRPRPHPAVVEWIRQIPADQLFVSAVTIGEIQAGIEITREHDATRADELEAWLGQVIDSFSVLPADGAAFQEWARLKHRQPDSLMEDALIAAVAVVHQLTVATRNERDFDQLGVVAFNPFEGG